jgi:hypothetical protein
MGRPESEVVVTSSVRSVEDGIATVAAEAVQDGKAIVRNARAEVATG